MSDPLRATARVRPDAPALDDGVRVWSYAELDAVAGRMARRLAPLGARPGATVALAAHPSALCIQTLFAVPRTGATFAILNPRLGSGAMERALDAVAPDLLLSTDADVGALGLDRDWFTTIDDLPKAPPGRDTVEEEAPAATVHLLWTSGTSGEPGVVPVTMAALDASARAVSTRLDLGPDDRWYASLSPAHIGGLALIHRTAHAGACLLALGAYSTEALVELIEGGEVTHASLVPTMLRQLLDARGNACAPAGLRCLLVGGAPAGSDLVGEAVGCGYPVALTYGLTEACSQAATAPPDLVAAKPGTVGLPLDGVELRLLESGEIRLRGPTVAPSFADEEGWLRTGDFGSVDQDGHLWITGRKDERVVTGGVNVHPAAVEDAIRDVPGVADVAVVGVHDETWGEVVGALVVAGSEEPDLHVLRDTVRRRLSGAEVPRRIVIARALPTNVNGKVDRAGVRARLRSEPN